MEMASADWGSVPDWTQVGLALTGGAAAIVRRRRRRVDEFRSLVEELSGHVTAQVLERLQESPELEELVTRAIEAVAITAHERKRRLLAQVVASSVVDDALVDEGWLLVKTIDAIGVPHIRALVALASGGREEVEAQLGEVALVLLSQLQREGLAYERYRGTYGGGEMIWEITPYGDRLLEYLRQ